MNSCFDPYQVLMVPRSANGQEIRSAFRKLIGEWHPDVATSPDAHGRAAAIIEAYRTLSHPERRSRFDRRQVTTPPPGGFERRCGDRRRSPHASGLTPAWRAVTLTWVLAATVIVTGAAATEWRNAHADDISELLS